MRREWAEGREDTSRVWENLNRMFAWSRERIAVRSAKQKGD
jgi:hypothetical protein